MLERVKREQLNEIMNDVDFAQDFNAEKQKSIL